MEDSHNKNKPPHKTDAIYTNFDCPIAHTTPSNWALNLETLSVSGLVCFKEYTDGDLEDND